RRAPRPGRPRPGPPRRRSRCPRPRCATRGRRGGRWRRRRTRAPVLPLGYSRAHGLAGLRGGGEGRARGGALRRRARGGARPLRRSQVGARPGAPRCPRPRERHALERDPDAARGGDRGAGAGAAAARARARGRTGRRRDDPGPPGGARPAAPADADPARDRGHLPRPRVRGLGRRGGRDRLGELRRAHERPRTPLALGARHVLPRRAHGAAHAYLAGPDPRDARTQAADLPHLAGPLLPPRHARRDALADLPPGRGARRRPRHHARAPAGDGAAVLPRPLRPGARGADADELLPVHRAVRRVRRDVLHLLRAGLCDVQAFGLDRDGRRRLGRPGRLPQRRPRSRRVAGLRVRLRDRAHRDAPPRHSRPAHVLGERPARAGAVLRVPVSWLREYVDFDLPVPELARRLVFTSCEVDRIIRRGVPDAGGNLAHFVVGKVLEAGKHPNADKLQLTKVDVGEGEPRSIVCGAWNFGVGATVAVVTPGGVMPGGEFTIERRKLRGEVSDGMILSERELELGQDHGGIMVLPDELEAGTPLVDVLPLGDDVLEIETLYNRPDLTSIYGIAREVSALLGSELRPMPGTDPERTADEVFPVEVEDLAGCPRFIARVFRDVAVAHSPPWLKARLIGAGMRPISNVVDVTNYVMLALGSPLHAYDAETLRGGIVVRRARPGEQLTTLDGTTRELDP